MIFSCNSSSINENIQLQVHQLGNQLNKHLTVNLEPEGLIANKSEILLESLFLAKLRAEIISHATLFPQ